MNEGSDLRSESGAARKQWTDTFLPEPFRGMRLSDYPQPTEQHRSALEAAQRYVDDTRGSIRRPLVLFGKQNTGKTMLASCVWNELAWAVPDRHSYDDAKDTGTADNIAFVTGAELVTWFRRASNDEDDRLRIAQKRAHICSCYLAVIDDVDKFPSGDWGNALYDVINARVWASRLPTILTTNLVPSAFAQRYGDAGKSIVSRLVRAGAVFIHLDEQLTQQEVRP